MVTAMTLAYYDERALHLNRRHWKVNRCLLWGRGSGSRFCPNCLATSDGRWQLSWRLGWSFACLQHRQLLADCCPVCGRIPRQRPRSGKAIPVAAACGTFPARPEHPPTGGCGFDLTQTRTLRLPTGHPVLTSQQRLMSIIDTGVAAFGTYALNPQPAPKTLTDIRAIAGRVLADLPEQNIKNLLPADITREHLTADLGSRLATRATERPGFMAPPRAASTAVAATIALQILEQPDAHQAGKPMRDLIDAMRDQLSQVSTTSIDGWGRGLSPVLNAVHLAALAPSLRPSEQLRYRTPTAMPRRPTKTAQDITRRARNIPSMFWPFWTVRLAPAGGTYPRILAPVLAACLLIIDGRANFEDVAQQLGQVTDASDISRVLQRLGEKKQWPAIIVALTRITDHLDATDVPIDYRRRRRLNYSDLLPPDRWQKICRRTGTILGNGRRELLVRSLQFQRISGLPAEMAPTRHRLEQAAFRAESAHFAASRTPELDHELNSEAESFLAAQHIDEPVTWQPPLSLIADLDLPGADPTLIDITRLHQLVREHASPVRHTANTLGTSIEAVRAALQEQPAPALPPTPSAARATGQRRFTARQTLPKKAFNRLYLDEHLSLGQIADHTGFFRHVLTDLAREYGIALRRGPENHNRHRPVDRDWLMEQYVVRRRTVPDLAREKGMSIANMARWAHTHEIPLRPRGGASHDTALRARETAASALAILRPAFTAAFGRQRLERFMAALPYPTLGAAAQALGTTQAVLSSQITRLERDLGQPLLERAERGRPMKPTAFGRRVATAAIAALAADPTRCDITSVTRSLPRPRSCPRKWASHRDGHPAVTHLKRRLPRLRCARRGPPAHPICRLTVEPRGRRELEDGLAVGVEVTLR
jgi:DNA-binding transcriptional LysR family regulator